MDTIPYGHQDINQADIDVVGRAVLPFHHDVEVVRVMVEALGAPVHPAARPADRPARISAYLATGLASRTTSPSLLRVASSFKGLFPRSKA